MKISFVAMFGIALLAAQTPAHAQDMDFLLINNSSVDLVEFNLSDASSDDWEENMLAGGVLAPDYEIGVLVADGLSTCIYDLRGVFADGSEVEEYDLNLCDLREYTFED
ncbi:MAG: hypothetical protein AB3N15_11030 [Paracoccaceae bacterium]